MIFYVSNSATIYYNNSEPTYKIIEIIHLAIQYYPTLFNYYTL